MTLNAEVPAAPRRHIALALVAALLVLTVLIAVYKTTGLGSTYPDRLTWDIATPVDAFADWVSETFRFLLKPLSDAVKVILKDLDRFVLGLPWLVPFAVLTLSGVAAGGWRLGVLTAAVLLLIGCLGLWKSSLTTLDIMALSVALTIALGVPLGIWAASSDRVEAWMRPVLDAMQTMPTFVYLIPVMLLFGIGSTAAVFATIVYAAPPVIRMTNLGLRQVPRESVEAARSFGSTYLQELLKVRLPLARPSIMMGVNQTIMMALGMVIFVALIGAEGLGKEIWFAMRRLKIGEALEAGLVVVLLAIVFDRFGYALTRRMEFATREPPPPAGTLATKGQALHDLIAELARSIATPLAQSASLVLRPLLGPSRADAVRAALVSHPTAVAGLLIVVALVVVDHWVVEIGDFPRDWRIDFRRPVDEAVRWMNVNLAVITDPLRAGIYIYGLGPIKEALLWLPWPAIVGAACFVGWRAGGPKLVALALATFLFIGTVGLWDNTMITIAQVAVALLLSLLLALPLGIAVAKSDRLDALMRPVLDTMQTLPAFVYLPLVVMLFKVGDLAGIIATVIYAMPPAVRLTGLGIRQVMPSVREAARSFGSTPGQTLRKIELPLALPSIMIGINQTTIMALAMVVYAALIGAKGLGADVLVSIGRFDVGGGFTAGMSIVLLAILLDRITQGFAERYRRSLGGRE